MSNQAIAQIAKNVLPKISESDRQMIKEHILARKRYHNLGYCFVTYASAD